MAMLSVGMVEFMMDLMDESMAEGIRQLMDRALSLHLNYHQMLFDAGGADMTSFGDSSCGPDLISAQLYRNIAMPYHKKIASVLGAKDIPNLCHICGNMDIIIDDLANVGFSAIEVDYKTDIVRAAKALSDKSTMFGPIDPSGVFYFGSPEKIADETNKALEIFDGKNIVIGAGCALPPGVKSDNINAFVKTVNSYNMK